MFEVFAQPSTATRPSRASMPTAIRPGKSRAASRTKSGSRTAAVPMMTRVNPALQPAAHRLHVAHAAAELHLHRQPGENPLDRLGVDGLAGEGAVEIDDMQIFEPLLGERARLRGGVGVEHRRLRHVAAQEPHAFAVLEVDGGKKDHGRHFRKLAISLRPSVWLFSGWNCVPTMLSRATIAVTGPP